MRNHSRDCIRTNHAITIGRTLSGQRQSGSVNKDNEVIVGKYKYDPKDELGKGFSGHVFKGVETDNPHKRYAIKVVCLKKFRGSNLEMLQGQIQTHMSLQHQHIVKLLQVIKTSYNYYLVMQYCPHGNLREYIAQKKQLSQSNALQIINQVVSGYRYLLSQGIMHRDIKPANILRMGNKWKISDFGFAVRSRFGFKDRMNVGTPLYMAPQSLKKSYYSLKSDIYSIGIILYEMLVGQTPNQAQSQKQLMYNISRDVALPKPARNPRITQFINKACMISQPRRMGKEEFMVYDFEFCGSVTHSINSSTVSIKDRNFSGTTDDSTSKQKCSSTNKFVPTDSKNLCRTSSNRSQLSLKQQPRRPFNPIIYNKQLQQKQFTYIKNFYHSIQNSDCFDLQQNNRNILMLTLFKLLLKLLRLLCDKTQNSLHLDKWQEYSQCKLHQDLMVVCNQHSEQYQKEYLDFIKYNDIKVIRTVNRKFPQLCHNAPLTTRFYQNLKDFMGQIIKQKHQRLSQIEDTQGEGVKEKYQALSSAVTTYKLAQTRCDVPFAFPNNSKPSVLEDYGHSKMTKSEMNSLCFVAKDI